MEELEPGLNEVSGSVIQSDVAGLDEDPDGGVTSQNPAEEFAADGRIDELAEGLRGECAVPDRLRLVFLAARERQRGFLSFWMGNGFEVEGGGTAQVPELGGQGFFLEMRGGRLQLEPVWRPAVQCVPEHRYGTGQSLVSQKDAGHGACQEKERKSGQKFHGADL